jgi:ABC-type amino acid transport substrate-binding protein
MKRKAIFWNFIWMLLFVLLFLPNTVMAQRREQNVPLRVGFVEEHGYFYKDAYGEYSGYISELLHSIAMFGNYDLEVVEFSSYAEENQALLEGRIDMETAVPRTEQWEQQYAFSNLPTATIVLSLVVKDDNNNYVYGDANAVNGMKVAAVKGDATGNYFKEWCQKTIFTLL